MLKKLTQQATDLILHSIASGEVMGANLLITKGTDHGWTCSHKSV